MNVEASRVVDALPGMVWTALPDGSIDFVNQRWCEFTKLDAGESSGHGWQTAIHPEDLPGLLERWRSIVASGQPGEMQARLRRFDGEYRWFLFRACPLGDESGRSMKWCGMNTDIDDQRRGEALLVGEKQLFELLASGRPTSEVLDAICRLVESMAGGCYCSVVLLDSSGTRVEHGAAPSLPDSFIASIIGRPVAIDAGPCGMAAYLNEQVIAADLTTETRWVASGWCPMALAHGLKSCWSTPIPSATGKVLGTFALLHGEATRPTSLHQSLIEQLTHIASIAIDRHLSEETLNRIRSELTHVARAQSLGVLTASIAHEVNQPLSGIITNASTCLRMLAADPPNIDGARETARRAIRDGNRASEVITRLRTLFSNKDSTTESVDLNEATREVIALSSSELQRSGVILRVEFADDLPHVTGNRVQIQQVILNLLRNASDAMSAVYDRPRELLVRSERDGDCVRLTVRDTGIGFDREDADRLFQAFYTTKNDGMGIGLCVSRSIVESHHGRLWATPNNGPGATFSFSLPVGAEGSRTADGRELRAFAVADRA
jgi:PAS domain S-box-containing protein